MCLAIPSKIIRIVDQTATIDVGGAQRQASLLLLEDVKEGDYVIVHAGFAITKIDETAALETIDLFRDVIGDSDFQINEHPQEDDSEADP
jgi:hydrogenase expression/formation protein HypC